MGMKKNTQLTPDEAEAIYLLLLKTWIPVGKEQAFKSALVKLQAISSAKVNA